MPAHAVTSKKNSDFASFDFLLDLSNKHINTKIYKYLHRGNQLRGAHSELFTETKSSNWQNQEN